MANPWGGGGVLVTMPTTPWPARLEPGAVELSAAADNPFTGGQQIQDWQGSYRIGSCTLPPMNATDGVAWTFFMGNLRGMVNVFQFMPDLIKDSRYAFLLSNNLQTTGASKYFRLTSNDYHVSISPGGIYKLSFEFREAL